MRRKLSKACTVLLAVSLVFPQLWFLSSPPAVAAVEPQDAAAAYRTLRESMKDLVPYYHDYIKGHPETRGEDQITASSDAKAAATLGYHDQVSYTFEVEHAGFYAVSIPYTVEATAMNNVTLSMTLDGERPFREASTLDVPLIWADESKTFELDSYGDEALPNQKRVTDERSLALYDNTYRTSEPMLLYLESGSHTLQFENISSDEVTLGDATIQAPSEIPSYEAYRSELGGELPADAALETIDAISYSEKNSSFVRLGSLKSPDVSPYDPVDRKINIIDGGGWNKGGQAIEYTVSVPETGDYALSFHYLNSKDDYSVFRTIEINDQLPFAEFKDVPFPFTDGRWNNLTLGGDTPYLVRLEAGENRIRLTATQGLVSEDINRMQMLIDHINQFALEIRKITGKDIDQNRTWRLTEYLPETESYLQSYRTLIQAITESLGQYAPNGTQSSTLSFLNKANVKIDRMLEKPDELPLYFEDLYSGTGSVTQMLGDTIDRMNNAGMSLDSFYLHGSEQELPRARASFFSKIAGGFNNFISTFTQDKYLIRPDEEAVNVWVSRPITYVDIMQKQVDSQFTPRTGIKVKLSVMPDANRLILSNAAGQVPDVALGLPSYMPYDIAIRGAAYPMTAFEDFWSVAQQSTPGAFIPYIYNDEVYALPETLDFQAMVYRRDVFNSLELEVPETWNDVIGILPVLQRYGMNFYHSIAGGVATKWFYQTSPLIYQNDGTLYEKDGFYAAIDEPQAVQGLTQLTELFTTYSMPIQVPNFYNSFRYNQLPIGMIDFNTYLQIQNAAPELKGQWALADYPGVPGPDGEVRRWYIANGTGAVLMDTGKEPTEAWDFLKWWTSTETQTEYANLLSSTYGPEYVWLSSNLEAAANAPIPAEDKEVILRSIPWLRDVPRTPGQYMLERGLSDVWSQAVQNGDVPRVAIDEQMIVINREIRRKMMEFGFLDQEGTSLKPYTVRDIDWVEAQMQQAGTKDGQGE